MVKQHDQAFLDDDDTLQQQAEIDLSGNFKIPFEVINNDSLLSEKAFHKPLYKNTSFD